MYAVFVNSGSQIGTCNSFLFAFYKQFWEPLKSTKCLECIKKMHLYIIVLPPHMQNALHLLQQRSNRSRQRQRREDACTATNPFNVEPHIYFDECTSATIYTAQIICEYEHFCHVPPPHEQKCCIRDIHPPCIYALQPTRFF